MEFIWNCMMLPIQFFLGIFFWIVLFCLVSIVPYLILTFLAWIIPKKPKREKYQGKPIIIKGGKDAK